MEGARVGVRGEGKGNSTARKQCRVRKGQEAKPRSLTTVRGGGCKELPWPYAHSFI